MERCELSNPTANPPAFTYAGGFAMLDALYPSNLPMTAQPMTPLSKLIKTEADLLEIQWIHPGVTDLQVWDFMREHKISSDIALNWARSGLTTFNGAKLLIKSSPLPCSGEIQSALKRIQAPRKVDWK